jgi:hypothetical protein
MPKWFYIFAAVCALAGVLSEGPTYFLHDDDASLVARSSAAVTYLTLGTLIGNAPHWLRRRRRSKRT